MTERKTGAGYRYWIDDDGMIVIKTEGATKIFLSDNDLKKILDDVESEESHRE